MLDKGTIFIIQNFRANESEILLGFLGNKKSVNSVFLFATSNCARFKRSANTINHWLI
jgi:hypothetical protein